MKEIKETDRKSRWPKPHGHPEKLLYPQIRITSSNFTQKNETRPAMSPSASPPNDGSYIIDRRTQTLISLRRATDQ